MVDKSKLRLRDLPGLGVTTEQQLKDVGIDSVDALQEIGALAAFQRLCDSDSATNPSLNFLYALVGALEGKSWLTIAREDRLQLLMQLEGYKELEVKIRGGS